MNFILIIDILPLLTKNEINKGEYSSKLSEIVSIIRNVFLLSNNIRKDNNLIIFCSNQFNHQDCKSLIIHFEGKKLRYLAPDERTTIFILQKVLNVALDLSTKKIYQKAIEKYKNNEWATTTPGISIKRSEFFEIFELFNAETLLMLNCNLKKNGLSEKVSRDKAIDLEDLSMKINNSTVILLQLNNASEFSCEKFSKVIYANTQHINIFENKEFHSNFFIWEMILILQTIKANLSD